MDYENLELVFKTSSSNAGKGLLFAKKLSQALLVLFIFDGLINVLSFYRIKFTTERVKDVLRDITRQAKYLLDILMNKFNDL